MNEFILIIIVYAGIWSTGDSVAITNVPGYSSKASCEEAGKAVKILVSGTKKDIKYTCTLR